jgi:hypothetical protein
MGSGGKGGKTVLPGHGDRIKLTPEEMRHQLRLLVDHRLAALAS